jgi:predicted phosphodiesterase
MKLAVFSDVHGNLTGLEAALADIEQNQPDEIIFAGDLCAMGPRPAECLELVRTRHLRAIYGNTDEWLIDRQAPPQHMQESARWAQDRLAADAREWLAGLPFQLRYSPTDSADDDLLVVHANSHDVNQIIFPPETMQTTLYGHVRQSDDDLEPLLTGLDAGVMAFGHLHIPSIRPWRGKTLANISSISLPGDEDPRAKYAIFTWTGSRWQIDHHRVSFDLNAEASELDKNPIPGMEEAMQLLASRRYIPQRV